MTIVVASGKGGTGKTTVSVGLARAIEDEVDLLDCDVEAPNAHLFLPEDANDPDAGGRPARRREETDRFAVPVPSVDPKRCTGCGACARFCAFGALAIVRGRVLFFDDLCHACGGCTIACPVGAISEVPHEIGSVRERRSGSVRLVTGELDVGQTLAPPLIRAVKARARARTIVIDAAPGATCPVVEAARGADAGLLVTENTPFGVHDLAAAAEVLAELRVPAGIVINRAGIGYADESEIEAIAERFGSPILSRIPYSARIAEGYASGRAITDSLPELAEELRSLATRLRRLAGREGAA
ncbi:MAG: 4Fe-4S binding protein [Spirochaetota bacterium]